MPNTPKSLTIGVIGDVHNAWDADDELALRGLGVDLVLLVGDFGNEAVDVVRSVAALELPKAVVLGNHDAWYSASPWGMKQCPYDRAQEDRVQQQLDLLGDVHVGYGKREFPELGLTVVGARPFSWGGSDWKNGEFYRSRYGIHSFEDSANRIAEIAATAEQETVIFLGHCGPLGLGDRPEDPCGRDWNPLGGDHGDPDFAIAIDQTRQQGKRVPLVTFGHMHHQLRHTKQILRTPVVVDAAETVFVNAASVPRIVRGDTGRGDSGRGDTDRAGTSPSGNRRNVTLVKLQNNCVTQVTLVWVDQDFAIVSEQSLYQSAGLLPVARP